MGNASIPLASPILQAGRSRTRARRRAAAPRGASRVAGDLVVDGLAGANEAVVLVKARRGCGAGHGPPSAAAHACSGRRPDTLISRLRHIDPGVELRRRQLGVRVGPCLLFVTGSSYRDGEIRTRDPLLPKDIRGS